MQIIINNDIIGYLKNIGDCSLIGLVGKLTNNFQYMPEKSKIVILYDKDPISFEAQISLMNDISRLASNGFEIKVESKK